MCVCAIQRIRPSFLCMCLSLIYVFSPILPPLPTELSLPQGVSQPVPPEIWQQPDRRRLDLPFSHLREAVPSHVAAAVKPGGETPTQSIRLMECAGKWPEGVCPIAVCAQLRGWLFPVNHKPGQTAAWEINCLTSPISRRLLCREDHGVLSTPPAVSQALIFDATGRHGKVLGNPLGFGSAILSYGTVFLWFSACFLA